VRVKAIQDLAQLSESALFTQIEHGTTLCVANAKRIHADCLSLVDQKRPRGAEILRLAAQEEAAKVLILLDAIRCPRATLPAEFARQLQYFNDHLAKGIYAQYCGLRPATLGEIREWVDLERKEFYLDGPNGVDWIFYNDILRRREETIYVDYVENDGQHRWHDPQRFEDVGLLLLMPARDPVLRLVNALNDAGCLVSAALEVIARIWRPVALDDDLAWSTLRDLNSKTLEAMQAQGLWTTQADEASGVIINEWLFPLYSIDLRRERVDKNQLRDVQQRWSPAW
jgi:AbiV family abortive infection protein